MLCKRGGRHVAVGAVRASLEGAWYGVEELRVVSVDVK